MLINLKIFKQSFVLIATLLVKPVLEKQNENVLLVNPA
jgi:hypothetical protein